MTAAMSDRVREEARSSLEKYDYYVLGIAAAVFAYAVDRWQPGPLGVNTSTIQAVAIACLFTAIVTGMKRLGHTIDHKYATSAQLFTQEQSHALPPEPSETRSAHTGSSPPTQAHLWREAYRHAELQAVTQAETARSAAQSHGAVRDWALIAGVLLIAAAKSAPAAPAFDAGQSTDQPAASSSEQTNEKVPATTYGQHDGPYLLSAATYVAVPTRPHVGVPTCRFPPSNATLPPLLRHSADGRQWNVAAVRCLNADDFALADAERRS